MGAQSAGANGDPAGHERGDGQREEHGDHRRRDLGDQRYDRGDQSPSAPGP
jgi:hypothetical protein